MSEWFWKIKKRSDKFPGMSDTEQLVLLATSLEK